MTSHEDRASPSSIKWMFIVWWLCGALFGFVWWDLQRQTYPWASGVISETRDHSQMSPDTGNWNFKELPQSGKSQLDLSFASRLGTIWTNEPWGLEVDFRDKKQDKKSKRDPRRTLSFWALGIGKDKVFRKQHSISDHLTCMAFSTDYHSPLANVPQGIVKNSLNQSAPGHGAKQHLYDHYLGPALPNQSRKGVVV